MTPPEQSYRTIPLTRGLETIVNAEDFTKLSEHKWYALQCKDKTYAARKSPVINGFRYTILMHREILGLPFGDPRQGDHRESLQTLDNRRSNLRVATHAENTRNIKKRRDNTSGFKGVHYDKKWKKWLTGIAIGGKYCIVATSDTREEAYEKYKAHAQKQYGEFYNPG